MRKIFLLVIFLLAGCATETAYKENLNSWIGHTEKELTDSWGVPDSFYNKDGYKYLTYNYIRNQYIPNVYTIGKPYSGGFITMYCKTVFELEDDIIVFYDYSGNGCRM